MPKHSPGPWTFTLGNAQNPYNGEVRSFDGELLVLRATMNPNDAANMRLIAKAPTMADLIRRLVDPRGAESDFRAALDEGRALVAALDGKVEAVA